MNLRANFKAADGSLLSIEEVTKEVVAFVAEAPEKLYRITIRTDSELLRDKSADFVTAIVVHRVGNGGRYFYRRDRLRPFHTLRDRIIREVLISLDAGQKVLEELRAQPELAETGKWEFEIHADIGANGKTAEMIKEVVGMIRAYDFVPQTKPESYAASAVADRHV